MLQQRVADKINELHEGKYMAIALLRNQSFEEALEVLRHAFLSGIDDIAFEGMEAENLPMTFAETGAYSHEDAVIGDLIAQVEDTMVHKIFVLQSCLTLAQKLEKAGEKQKAYLLIRRAYVHDLSKLNEDEFFGFAKFATDLEAMSNIKVQLPSAEKLKIISLHWKRNSHHPEYYSKIDEMSEMDVIEMCCDWHARSIQFGTNTIEWLEVKFQDRFSFTEDMYAIIYSYCQMVSQTIKKKKSIR